MADRPKLPKSIVVLNIIMAVVLLAICALAVALFVQAKGLGWSLRTALRYPLPLQTLTPPARTPPRLPGTTELSPSRLRPPSKKGALSWLLNVQLSPEYSC